MIENDKKKVNLDLNEDQEAQFQPPNRNKIIDATGILDQRNLEKPLYIPMNYESTIELKVHSKPLLVFDIDGTLYDQSYEFGKVWIECLKSTFAKMNKKFFLDKFQEYSRMYGAGVKGYFLDKSWSLSDYKIFIDSIPFSMFRKDPDLRKYLSNLDVEKWCFTNACETHASRVLEKLGVEDMFDVVIHCDYPNKLPIHKPMDEAYHFVEKISGTQDIIFFDDLHNNVERARANGWMAYHAHKKTNIIDLVELALKEYQKKKKNVE